MTLKTPLWQEDSAYSATLDRELIDALSSASGILTATDLFVTQRAAGANMSVDVAAGRCIIAGTDQTGQGKYLCKSDAVTNVTIATAPGTGLSRIDLIVAAVQDADQNGGANNNWVIEAVTGTAAATGSQVAPAAPASSMILATVAVGPNVTQIFSSVVTDKRVVGGLGNLASVAGNASAAVNITTSLTTFLTTPPLAVGTWDITMTALIQDTGGNNIDVTAAPGTGTMTILGTGSSSLKTSGQVTLTFIAVVTVAGTLIFRSIANATTSTPQVLVASLVNGITNVTGFTATKIV